MNKPDVEWCYELPRKAEHVFIDEQGAVSPEGWRKLARVELTHVRMDIKGYHAVPGSRLSFAGAHGSVHLGESAIGSLWPRRYRLSAPVVWLPGDPTRFRVDGNYEFYAYYITLCGWFEPKEIK